MTSVDTAESAIPSGLLRTGATDRVEKTRPGTRHIVGLDLVRFAAALFVMFHHFLFDHGTHPDIPFASITWAGWVSVQTFFVLSGFVIAYSAHQVTALKFAESRVVRLYPAAWICSSLTFFCILLNERGHPFTSHAREWVTSFFLLPISPYIDSVYWTLRVEIAFYFLVFLLVAVHRFQRLPAIITIAAITNSLGWVCFLVAQHFGLSLGPLSHPMARFYAESPYFAGGIPQFLPFFAIGVLFWKCTFDSVSISRVIAILLCCCGGVLQICFHASFVSAVSTQAYSSFTPICFWIASLVAIIAAIRWNSFLLANLGPRNLRLCTTLGMMTYPLYLFHQMPGGIFMGRVHPYISDRFSALLAIAGAIATSYIICRYLEKPIQTVLRRLFHLRSDKSAVPTASLP
jgi:exopolysaccharide production protein ExoZ